MKAETNNQLKIKLTNEEADNFKSALKKIISEEKEIGFRKSKLNDAELKVIQDLSDKITDK